MRMLHLPSILMVCAVLVVACGGGADLDAIMEAESCSDLAAVYEEQSVGIEGSELIELNKAAGERVFELMLQPELQGERQDPLCAAFVERVGQDQLFPEE